MDIIDRILIMDWRDIAIRALWTFLQAFLAVVLVAGESIIDLLFAADWTGLWALTVAVTLGAVAAGLSALKTVVVETLRIIRN